MSSDPRRPDKIVPFHMPPPTDDDSDYTSNIAMYTAMSGIFLRNKIKAIPWVASYFGLSSYLNSRKSQKSSDVFGGGGHTIALISLVSYYINVYVTHKRALMSTYDVNAVDEGINA
ncbi:hypothetical protein BJ944DRAFT_261859 [Cunninghamella echinulata]|nr:hypothetical protein BJ944DRAFT_261859 [Cunninghamella echinulata]